jgi:hypothetical protein
MAPHVSNQGLQKGPLFEVLHGDISALTVALCNGPVEEMFL